MADVAVFGVLFVALDMVDGFLARRSKAGPTLVGGALDVESDSIAVLFVSLAASRKVSSSWRRPIIARYFHLQIIYEHNHCPTTLAFETRTSIDRHGVPLEMPSGPVLIECEKLVVARPGKTNRKIGSLATSQAALGLEYRKSSTGLIRSLEHNK